MKLIEVTKAFATEEQCLAYFEASRWPNGVRCLTCGSKEISRITRKVNAKEGGSPLEGTVAASAQEVQRALMRLRSANVIFALAGCLRLP